MNDRDTRDPHPQPTFKKLTLHEQAAVMKLLSEVCERTEDGMCLYKEGYDDQRVMREAAPNYMGRTATGVVRIRRQLYGDVRKVRHVNPVEALEERVALLEAKLRAFCSLLGVSEGEFDAL